MHWQGNDRRVHDKEVDSDEEQSSRGSPRRSLDEHESAENEPDEAMPAELSAEALAAHRDAMFVSSATGPAATGLPPLAAAENRKVPRLLVKLASACVNLPLYPQASADALSASFGNFDRVVALGWLIADAVRLPLLSRAEAYAIGLKARREAGNIKSEEAGDKKAASRLALGWHRVTPSGPR